MSASAMADSECVNPVSAGRGPQKQLSQVLEDESGLGGQEAQEGSLRE